MPSFLAFSDELTKIAFARQIGQTAQNLGRTFKKEFWQGGKFNKGLTALGLAGTAFEVAKQDDPRGLDRSRFERLTAGAGGIVGGTFGTTYGSRLGGGKGWKSTVGGLAGGLAGGIVGERVMSFPMRRARLQRQAQEQQQLEQSNQLQPQQLGNGGVA